MNNDNMNRKQRKMNNDNMNRKQRRQREKEVRRYSREIVRCSGCGKEYRRRELFYDIIDGKPDLTYPMCKVCKENL